MMLFGLLTVNLVLSVAILCIHFAKSRSYWKRKGVLQARTKWVFGDSWKNLIGQESLAEMVLRLYKRFPNVRYYGTYQFNTPILLIKDTDLIKRIMIKDFEHFSDHRTFIPDTVDPLWGKNLFSLKGQKWRDMRLVLTPSFTTRKMKNMFILMKECAENFVRHLEDKSEEIIELDLKDTFTRYSCDVIASTAFGIETNSIQVPKNEFYQTGMELTTFSGLRSLIFFVAFFLPDYITKLLGIRVFTEKMTKFFTDVIDQTIKLRTDKGIKRPDMIDLLMEASKGQCIQEDENIIDTGFATAKTYIANKNKIASKFNLSNVDIVAQASIFFLGGLETVATEMRFLAYELAVNFDVQTRLRNEIDATFQKCEGNVTYEVIMKMNYLDMVVSESLRKWPSGVNLERVCTKSLRIPALQSHEKDIIIEKGTLVWLPIMGIHYDPNYYTDPNKFDPERFNENNRSLLNDYNYVPFGVGPRNCIGSRYAIMEMKVLFFHLLRKFEIIPVEKSKIPIEILKRSFTLDGDCFWFGLKRIYPK